DIVDIDAVLRAVIVQQGWHFNIIRTRMDIRKDDLTQRLGLKKEEPIGGLDYYTIQAELDSFSSYLFQKDVKDRKNEKPEPLAMYFADARTLVIGHVPAMKNFLELKGEPQNLTQPPPSGGANRGGPPGGMMGGMMGGPPGAGAGGGGPPGGMMGGPG